MTDHRSSATHDALLWLALGALLAFSWHSLRGTQSRTRGTRHEAPPHKIQRWEGEGGRPEPEPGAVTAPM